MWPPLPPPKKKKKGRCMMTSNYIHPLSLRFLLGVIIWELDTLDMWVKDAAHFSVHKKYWRKKILNITLNPYKWIRVSLNIIATCSDIKKKKKLHTYLWIQSKAHLAFLATQGMFSIALNNLCFSFESLIYVSRSKLYISENRQQNIFKSGSLY